MKKRLLTLWVAWLLAWSPNTHAQIDSTKAEINKDLVEIVSKEQKTSKNQVKTITFEDAKKQQEQRQFFEKIMENKRIQDLIEEYWQEEVEEMVNQIITSDDTQSIIEDALKDEKFQKALEDGNEEEVAKLVKEFMKDFYGESFWWKIIDKVFFGIMFVILWEWFKKRK